MFSLTLQTKTWNIYAFEKRNLLMVPYGIPNMFQTKINFKTLKLQKFLAVYVLLLLRIKVKNVKNRFFIN